jgi:putative DNA primase/helicase
MENFYQEEEPFTIDDAESVKHVYEALEHLRPTLVVFDTISLYIGKADTAKASETTQALSFFKEIARRYNCSVVIVRHLTKGNSKEKSIYRGQGSIAFTGVSRIVMLLGIDPQDRDTKVLGVHKINLAPFPKALTFTIRGLPDTLKDQDRSLFVWGGHVDLSTDDILCPPERDGGEKDQAEEFLRNVLGDGPRKVTEIETMAEKRAISARTLQRAAHQLGVERVMRGFGRGKSTFWSLLS